MIFKHFGDWLDYQIRVAGLSQKQLSIEIKVSETSISKWIQNRSEPRLNNLIKICKTIGRYQGKNEEKLQLQGQKYLKR